MNTAAHLKLKKLDLQRQKIKQARNRTTDRKLFSVYKLFLVSDMIIIIIMNAKSTVKNWLHLQETQLLRESRAQSASGMREKYALWDK